MMKKVKEPCPASNSPAYLTLRYDKGKVALSSSAYKYLRRGCWKGGEKERAGEDKQAAETKKKKEKPEGAKLLRNELEEEKNREGRNKFDKGDRRGLQRSRNRGGDFRVQS
jgi:hypothetical protein